MDSSLQTLQKKKKSFFSNSKSFSNYCPKTKTNIQKDSEANPTIFYIILLSVYKKKKLIVFASVKINEIKIEKNIFHNMNYSTGH